MEHTETYSRAHMPRATHSEEVAPAPHHPPLTTPPVYLSHHPTDLPLTCFAICCISPRDGQMEHGWEKGNRTGQLSAHRTGREDMIPHWHWDGGHGVRKASYLVAFLILMVMGRSGGVGRFGLFLPCCVYSSSYLFFCVFNLLRFLLLVSAANRWRFAFVYVFEERGEDGGLS